jgi:hypothetical protein
MRQPKVYYVSAPCSHGKTYQVRQQIEANYLNRNQLYLANSMRLITETDEELRAKRLPVKVITSETSSSVKKRIIDHCKFAPESDEILLMTHQAFALEPFIARPKNWDVYIDEYPQVIQFHFFSLPQTYTTLTDHIQVEDYCNTLYRIRRKDSLRQVIDSGFCDDTHKTFQKLFWDLNSGIRDVFVDKESWIQVLKNEPSLTNPGKFHFVSVFNINYFGEFNSLTILGANFTDSLIYHLFKEKVDFRLHPGIVCTPRPEIIPISQRAKIKYLLEPKYSKSLGSKKHPSKDISIADGMEQIVRDVVGDRSFIYAVNKDRENRTCLKDMGNGKNVPVVSMGVNCFDDIHAAYFGAALNFKPAQYRMLKALGLSSHVIRTAMGHEAAYQMVMRTSLRDPNSTHEVLVIVTDRSTAERLQQLFETECIERIGSIDIPESKPLTSAERSKRFRAKSLAKKLAALESQRDIIYKRNCCGSGSHIYDPISSLVLNGKNHVVLTQHDDPTALYHDEFTVSPMSFLDLRLYLQSQSKLAYNASSERKLYNLSYFGPINPGEKHYRTQDNFQFATGVILDFDGGNLSPQDATSLFWDDPAFPKVAHIMYSSFSRGPDDPNRFHMILALKYPITSIEDYKAVFNHLINRIEDAGFDPEFARIDRNFSSGNQSARLPGRNRNVDPSCAFFESRGCNRERDLNRYALDPTGIIEQARREREELESLASRYPNNRPRAPQDEINREIWLVSGLKEGRRIAYYRLGWKLRFMGLDWNEIRAVKLDIAGTDRKMLRRCEDNMNDYLHGYHSWMRCCTLYDPIGVRSQSPSTTNATT